MVALLDRLALQSPVSFMALFEGVTTRLQLIATFLGLLELLRRGLVRARQTEPGSEITIYRTVETAVETDGHPG